MTMTGSSGLNVISLHAAVSQRNMRENPGGLEQQKDDLAELLLEFYEQHLQHRFSLSDYTFDVYITTAGKASHLIFLLRRQCDWQW